MTEQKIEGIVNPSLDELIDKVDSKYALVLFAAQRARQINAYYSQLHEGLFEYVGPLVDTSSTKSHCRLHCVKSMKVC